VATRLPAGDPAVRVPPRERTPIFRFLEATVLPLMWLLVRIRREGTENVPRQGSFVVAPNHTSNIDPIVVGVAVYLAGRSPHFLGKASLWTVPLVGALLRATRQIPVIRGGVTRNNDPLKAATEAAAKGFGIIVYPEGTLTRDPDIWPMRGKTGAVRIALAAKVPLIPSAQWGTERLLPPYARFLRPFPRKTITVRFGEPLDLSRFDGKPIDSKVLTEATGMLMAAVVAMVEDLRGESAPTKRWDPADHNQSEFGHP
jgi:1-acyl-sn-glycerol-3-phosphate acyltransferase